MGFYKILFYGGIGCAIIFLILTIVLFFVLKIPAVFGNLSGSTQRKRIEEIRKTGYETVSKTKAIHDSTSKITVREAEMKTADSGKLEEPRKESKKDKKYSPRPDVGVAKVNEEIETEVLGYNEYKLGGEAPKARPAAEDLDIENTEVLREGEEASSDNPDEESTDVLRNHPSGLGTDDFETSNEEETAILGSDTEDDELFDNDLDEDVTDVLSNIKIEVEEKNAGKDSLKDMAVEITGNVGEDITSVLTSHDRTDIVNDMGSDIGSTAEMTSGDDDDTDYSDQITVIYSATVVNTSETLDD